MMILKLTFDQFNSYTQQICIDDAVLIDPNRAENVVSNDGTTMRIMAQMAAKPSAWTRQKEVTQDDRGEIIIEENRKLYPALEQSGEDLEAEDTAIDNDDDAPASTGATFDHSSRFR